jgi:hypothetical protein
MPRPGERSIEPQDKTELHRCIDVLDVGSGKGPIGGDQRNLSIVA